MDDNVIFAFDDNYKLRVNRSRYNVGLFVLGLLALLVVVIIIGLGIYYSSSFTKPPNLPNGTKSLPNKIQVISGLDTKESCENYCPRMTWDSDLSVCRCKNGFYGQYCQSEYGNNFKYVGYSGVTTDSSPISNLSLEYRLGSTGCEQACLDNPLCSYYYWSVPSSCGSTGQCILGKGTLTAASNSLSENPNFGYYIKNNDVINFTNQVFLSAFALNFSGEFWKNMGLFGTILDVNEYKQINFLPRFQKIPSNTIGIYSIVPFNYLNYESIIARGNTDYTRISSSSPDFPTSWGSYNNFYVYFSSNN